MDRIYLCIDLKSFYASCECAERNLDPLTTNLVVADSSRGDGTICLAITPPMKKMGVRNRCRLYEIPSDINYITAKPRMSLYIDYSVKIYGIYLRYLSKDDIHVYSIDEAFLDITKYLILYKLDPVSLANKIRADILNELHITATCGIGTNLYLAKIALDIIAKTSKDYIGFLDEYIYKKLLWNHRPLTDFWRIGPGIQKRLASIGVYDMEGITKASEEDLKKLFGVDYKILLDHANGIEPVTIKDIKNYKSTTNSLSTSQILFEDYSTENARIVLTEMIDVLVLNLTDNNLVTNTVGLMIGYSNDQFKPTGGSKKIEYNTDVYSILKDNILEIFDKTTNKYGLIRRIGISFENVVSKDYEYYDLFTDTEKIKKEQTLQKTINSIKDKYGKNSILRGTSLYEKATMKTRNKLIGGHNSGEE